MHNGAENMLFDFDVSPMISLQITTRSGTASVFGLQYSSTNIACDAVACAVERRGFPGLTRLYIW